MSHSLVFHHDSYDTDELWLTFWESPYFGVEAMAHREKSDLRTSILIARINGNIAWALTYSISPFDEKLKIWLIEVLPIFRWQEIGVQMLLEAERVTLWNHCECLAYLNNSGNIYSRDMFLKAWYKQFDCLKLIK